MQLYLGSSKAFSMTPLRIWVESRPTTSSSFLSL
ncbi:unnamed protein product [Ixodes hexagonus]